MNNEELVNKAIEPLLEMYTKIENDLLVMIAEHFKINAEFLNSDYWRIQKLEEMGLFNEAVIEYLAKYTNRTKEEILKALEEVGYDTFNINKLESAFENGKLRINPNTLLENNTIQNIINNVYNELSNHFIELSNKIANSTREAYLSIVEEAYLKTSMGTHSYQQAIRESLNSLSNKGITTLTYTTTDDAGNIVGVRNYDIEGTVRRDILTGVRSLSNDINKTTIEELECEWVYLSEHLRCRPTHFDWQGTVIKYEDLVDVTDYGDVAGLGGINCAHYFEPYFGDARGDELKSISKEDALEQYSLSQQQRYLERGLRKWKRKVEIFKTNGDIDAQDKSQKKVKEWQNRLKNFTEENNLRRDYTREYVSVQNDNFKVDNVNQSLNGAKETENNNTYEIDDNINFRNLNDVSEEVYQKYQENKFENLAVVDMNGNKIGSLTTSNSYGSVSYSQEQIELMKNYNRELIAIHNHPYNRTFSLTDIYETFNNEALRGIMVTSDNYNYYLFPNLEDLNKVKNNIKEFRIWFEDILEKRNDINLEKNLNLSNNEIIHISYEEIFGKLGWKYGRNRKN